MVTNRLQTSALWAFEDDIQNRSWLDWLKAHTSFSKPLHRYEGVFSFYQDRLSFLGLDRKTDKEISFDLFKHQIDQLYLGFDETFNLSEAHGLGLTWLPLRLKVTVDSQETYLYIITNYNFGRTDNKEWFELLKSWLE